MRSSGMILPPPIRVPGTRWGAPLDGLQGANAGRLRVLRKKRITDIARIRPVRPAPDRMHKNLWRRLRRNTFSKPAYGSRVQETGRKRTLSSRDEGISFVERPEHDVLTTTKNERSGSAPRP